MMLFDLASKKCTKNKKIWERPKKGHQSKKLLLLRGRMTGHGGGRPLWNRSKVATVECTVLRALEKTLGLARTRFL